MAKANVYGMNKTFIPNSKADQKRFKKKAKAGKVVGKWTK